MVQSNTVLLVTSAVLLLGLILNNWDDSNDERLRTFTVRSADFTMDILGPLVLPVSQLYDLVNYWRVKLKYWTGSGRKNHDAEVAKTQEQVRLWQKENRGRKMCTSRPNWMSITASPQNYKSKMYQVNLGNMGNILFIDPEKRIVKVEPSVEIGYLNRALVAEGFTLPIVPELDQLTVGGLVAGAGIESTSHVYGLFHKTSVEYELVTADANLIIANETVNQDVFHAVPMSYGTLGFLTAVTLRIVPYKPFVRLEYSPAKTLDRVTELFSAATLGDSDSVEGILYSRDEGVIMTGKFVDEADVDPNLVSNIGLWYKPWFYLHVMTALETGPRLEFVPTLQFHQRHNKPAFWLTHIILPYGHKFLFRLLFGWMLPLNNQFIKMMRQAYMPKEAPYSNFVLQDFLIPLEHLKKSLEFTWEQLEIMPVWLAPFKVDEEPAGSSMVPRYGPGYYVDIGLYGCSPRIPEQVPRPVAMKNCEKFTLDHGGQQATYAQTYMSREQFRDMFPRGLYDSVRDRLPLCKEGFPDVYDKISKVAREDS